MSEFSSLPAGCSQCLDTNGSEIDFSMAFQPIVDIQEKNIFGYEALVRGPNQEPAGFILDKLNDNNRYYFDQAIRVKAIKTAVELELDSVLSINFFPNAVYRPETCIRTTLNACEEYGFPINKIMFEVTESERIEDRQHLKNIFAYYNQKGFITAIDDFGAGFSGLNLISDWQPNIVKLDMNLIRNIDKDETRQHLVSSVIGFAHKVGIRIICEGVETVEELSVLEQMNVSLFQGFLFAKPAFEALPAVDFSNLGLD
ncbi:EAL domain-containing protein [Methylophaga sp.]|jgi:EAL domain-containing protein (putative c-di-GMP-specific phosphodiesterase class I)|uniref:EAL domain-containing protein n=1 Tax=Methylophaga sp. TaxID=2024840 RepID=UPI0014019929|nr:EAL domain-containing protein [Methylophaga sp.]MTI63056.1 EAL domain-containing protein [Methylophaga sp.]